MNAEVLNKSLQLKKFEGKGGWVYVLIEGISQDKSARFGWVLVSGWIDDYELNNVKLMSMGQGRLFLPVKAEIRKVINKKEGDFVTVKLVVNNIPKISLEELMECFEDPLVLKRFNSQTTEKQQEMLDWINSSKVDKIQIQRIKDLLKKLSV